MLQNIKSIFMKLSHRIGRLSIILTPSKGHMDETPLRSELFSSSQMKEHGKTLAGLHTLTQKHFPERLLARLANNENALLEVHNHLIKDVKENKGIAPAGEWLLDNFYLIQEQIQAAKQLLPKGYAKDLPLLGTTPSTGLPRVYDIALETISHGDGRVDIKSLGNFVAAYQSIALLQLGELWAIPIMLRLALIENLRRVGIRIVADSIARNQAVYWADTITETAEKNPGNLILTVAEMARSNPPLVGAFVAEIARRLQGQDATRTLLFSWIEQKLSESSLTIAQLLHLENQRQAADQLSISNSLGSLRFLGAADWNQFVESMSVVEQTLQGDPAGVYGLMDFATRDRYRHTVEDLAKKSGLSEKEVARKAIELARENAVGQQEDSRAAHVGFFLLDKGLTQLQERAGVSKNIVDRLGKAGRRFSLSLYLGTIFIVTAIISLGIVAALHPQDKHGPLIWITSSLVLVCVSQLSIALVNLISTWFTKPHLLPRMDYSKGIPPESSTLVVVPTLLRSPGNIEGLIEALEVRFLANQGVNLRFGLLTDFEDASEETLVTDDSLLHKVRQGIEALNVKYKKNQAPFFLFHRPRLWNEREKIWMGYERKRGKLGELNQLIQSGSGKGFSLIIGDIKALEKVTYVITLDTDTELPRDSVQQLAGAMSHPLNRPVYDPDKGRIISGYGILQPRVAISLPGTNLSRYARMWGNDAGVDPYTRVVSDVYQDLFGEGSFIGKGIYDVKAFELVLKDRFPENLILSHDLIEGCYARSGLISDVQLYEAYPSDYITDVSRRRRWIRGDWQLLRWLFPCVPGVNVRFQKNPISILSRWKILDNLRRSLVPLALILLLLLGWTMLPSPWISTTAVMGIVVIPSLITALISLFRKPGDVRMRQHLSGSGNSFMESLSQAMFVFICLPHEAWFSTTAILRTLGLMLVSGKGLLEWNPQNMTGHKNGSGLGATLRSMWASPVMAMAAAGYLAFSRPTVLPVAMPVLILWFAAPFIAWRISCPLSPPKTGLSENQILFLRKLSRRTWTFFETFVGPEDHWLPPDNYQEAPLDVVAHRTSPTNIGLSLLSDLSACDFGYISVREFMTRTERTLGTLDKLDRYRGHFYNWYDTQSLKPLLPMYISSVDSGNLAASLLTLRAGLLALPDEKFLGKRLFDGLSDTAMVLADVAGPLLSDLLSRELVEFTSDMTALKSSPMDETPREVWRHLDRLAASSKEMVSRTEAYPDKEILWWTQALSRQCEAAMDEMTLFSPWVQSMILKQSPDIFPDLETIPSLRQLARFDINLLPEIAKERKACVTAESKHLLDELSRLVIAASLHARERITALENLARHVGELANAMEHGFLYDRTRRLLSIGYNVSEGRLDRSYYDLLASEARLTSFVAIAQGQIPQESWFSLGRLLTVASGKPVLISWSGSMFEYLMPLLVMPTYEQTLLDQTCRTAVAGQIRYGGKNGVPWGISESGYNMVDSQFNYQYKAFGVPGLGLKRGLEEDLVVAPYASALALMVAPEEACRNLEELTSQGFQGRYGFYEAIDYTPIRLPRGQSHAVVRSFMAHHQGMSFLSLTNLLLSGPMQKRFESDPMFQATMLLLQERLPRATVFSKSPGLTVSYKTPYSLEEKPIRVYTTPDTPAPEVQLLSNGRYHVMVTNAGGGYSRWKNLALTRWREDGACDNWGTFFYIRDISSGMFWSTAFQPVHKEAKEYEAIFSEGRAEFRRRDGDLETHTEIAVSPEDDIELRRITINNHSITPRTIEVTTYAEIVLAPPNDDMQHPAFSKLFVQTEILRDQGAILATRRPRSDDELTPWMFHAMSLHGNTKEEFSYETDRQQFIGRGNTLKNPRAMESLSPLSSSEGAVLDPIVAIRCRITLDPEKTVTVNVVTGAGETRAQCVELVDRYRDWYLADRVFELASTHGQMFLRQINATEADAILYQKLASSVLFTNSSLRAPSSLLFKNFRGQSGLWGYSISGDLPIVLLCIEDLVSITLVNQLIQAHTYWRLKGLAVDLVIWNENHATYRQTLYDQIMGLIAAGGEVNLTDRPAGIFVRNIDQISDEDRILFQAVARAIISDSRGTLAEQINRRSPSGPVIPALVPTRTHRPLPATVQPRPRKDLIFFNGTGGFTPDGREYIISTGQEQVTPAPWANVLANPGFGSIISENGPVYTWSENAHEYRLTPWHNDPVSDPSGEAFYLRDEERGHFWSPMPHPVKGKTPYVTRHGFGYTVFEHTERGIGSEVWVYVDMKEPVKFTVLKVRNLSGRSRRLSVSGYVEWVLGDLRHKTGMHVITETDPESGAMLARNPYSSEFGTRAAFFNVDHATRTLTGDRIEFLGRNAALNNPAAMMRSHLSGRTGAGLDPCGAIQVVFDLENGEEREIVFTLGAGKDRDHAAKLAHRFHYSAAAHKALEGVWAYWQHTLGTIQIETPDPSVNFLANGWLIYQVLASRLWGRSGFYQSGGAFGFRDQLQDTMSLVHAEPRLVREHLLLCAGRQFPEGDVQHWWHPPTGRGVRTLCSDDFLWLPLAVSRYVQSTGDTGVLSEKVHFITGRPVNPDEESYYDLPGRSEETASLYDHCVLAIRKGLKFGVRGLPLIGSGDWNDGMNMVGKDGKGESVWLAFFMYEVLSRFSTVARLMDDMDFHRQCGLEADKLRQNIKNHGWDGKWYLRAYFDDGTPLGSSKSQECRIDSIAQSWSVLSGAGDSERSKMAMEAVDRHLVRRDDSLIQLLDPPFDKSKVNPGYIKGYVPGVRENGGQYTHGAVWTAMAFAKLGDSRRAWELLSLINPVNHGSSATATLRYKTEPYVVAADVYAVPPHTGQGGWTWYTGSAAWMYRLIVESLVGLTLENNRLVFAPCLPPEWDGVKVHYRSGKAIYHITVKQSRTEERQQTRITTDGHVQEGQALVLVDDGREHAVEVLV